MNLTIGNTEEPLYDKVLMTKGLPLISGTQFGNFQGRSDPPSGSFFRTLTNSPKLSQSERIAFHALLPLLELV